jgi:hypothetical protein
VSELECKIDGVKYSRYQTSDGQHADFTLSCPTRNP